MVARIGIPSNTPSAPLAHRVPSPAFGAALMAAVVLTCIWWRRRTDEPQGSAAGAAFPTSAATADSSSTAASSSVEMLIEDIAREKPMRFNSKQLKRITSNYSERIGAGGFGVVYKGLLPNKVPVAVKLLNSSMEGRAEEQFMAEINTMSRTRHIGLIKLYGFCYEPVGAKALVFEFMPNGSLDKYLFDGGGIGFGKMQEIAIGTAKGIRYLHEECDKKIIHYDIKPENVLLDEEFRPKLADFGLAKLCEMQSFAMTVTGGKGTPGYAAPELWSPMPVTHKSDVYSFGMLLFEIVGRRRNLDVGRSSSQEWLPRWIWGRFEKEGGLAGAVVDSGAVAGEEDEDELRRRREAAARMWKVALWCVQYRPEGRPPMGSVVKMLEGEMEIAEPPNPFLHLIAADENSVFWNEIGYPTTWGSLSSSSSNFSKASNVVIR